MEQALWNGKIIFASEVANDYALETRIRNAAQNNELRCRCPDCPSPELRFAHGESRIPYFAHKDLGCMSCSYERYDSELPDIVRMLRHDVGDVLKTRGFRVKLDDNIIAGHYTHISAVLENGTKAAIEFVTDGSSEQYIIKLNNQYEAAGIPVSWVSVEENVMPAFDADSAYAKRIGLNLRDKWFTVCIDATDRHVCQYTDRGVRASQTYRDLRLFSLEGEYTSLTLVDGYLSLPDYAAKKEANDKAVLKIQKMRDDEARKAQQQLEKQRAADIRALEERRARFAQDREKEREKRDRAAAQRQQKKDAFFCEKPVQPVEPKPLSIKQQRAIAALSEGLENSPNVRFYPTRSDTEEEHLTLLTEDEFILYRTHIDSVYFDWALLSVDAQTFAYVHNRAVRPVTKEQYGNSMIRPALILDLPHLQGKSVGDKISLDGENTYTVISEQYALADDCIRWNTTETNCCLFDSRNTKQRSIL